MPRCAHGEWGFAEPGVLACLSCGKPRDEQAAARGFDAAQRGIRLERALARHLGWRWIGGANGPTDLLSPPGSRRALAGQVKSVLAARFLGWAWKILEGPIRADQPNALPVLFLVEAPAPGKKARCLVLMELDDWEVATRVGSHT